ncbi:YwqG family protein [Microlunatus soli]|uniref:YwqG family protein n=1 Tax=Microlunatus soli TaxID=630515 RepID=UPI000B844C1F|nr:DUF1963 domain-containing protein [Microlunatus soli]
MNAFWNRWRKQLAQVSVPSRSAAGQSGLSPMLLDDLRQTLQPVARDCAAISLAGAATSPIQSFLSGHPFLPPGAVWPEGIGGPQLFLGQLNFAEVGALSDFPAAGLLQWFVDADENWGLTVDASAGSAGFTVRWYPDPVADGSPSPDAPTPTDAHDELPMEFVGATALEFAPGISIPSWDELTPAVRADSVWERIALALGESRSEPAFVYEEYLRGSASPLADHRATSKIGGFPSFTQHDPRGTGGYPAVDTGLSELIIELDSMDVGGWGDSGVAHLFGDPMALAAGDTSGVRYHWDCL